LGFKKYWNNLWDRLDIHLAVYAVLDVWIVPLFALLSKDMDETGYSALTIMRMFRLLRIVRMARLLKLSTELRILVEGLFVQPNHWCGSWCSSFSSFTLVPSSV